MAISIRRAREQDAWAIRRLIWRVGINPMGLDWRRFIVAVDERDRVIGCGQVKPHGDDVRELASIAVALRWRGQGVARMIIERLLAETPLPLYLYCRPALGPFYMKFAFRDVEPGETPVYFQNMLRMFTQVHRLFPSFTVVRLMVKTA